MSRTLATGWSRCLCKPPAPIDIVIISFYPIQLHRLHRFRVISVVVGHSKGEYFLNWVVLCDFDSPSPLSFIYPPLHLCTSASDSGNSGKFSSLGFLGRESKFPNGAYALKKKKQRIGSLLENVEALESAWNLIWNLPGCFAALVKLAE